jgi:hypothetical protein
MKTVEARCLLDLEQTPYSFHAYSIPLDIEIQPGDEVLLHDAPSGIGFNEQLVRECRITVRRAGPLDARERDLLPDGFVRSRL